MRTNSEINTEIHNHGVAFFEAVRQEVRGKATRADSPVGQEANRLKLDGAVAVVMDDAILRVDLDHEELWQVLWQRVVYAGPRASKSEDEIISMRKLVPLFQSLAGYTAGHFVFDKKEWAAFKKRWKTRSFDAQWLARAKTDSRWNPAAEFKNTSPDVWKLLVKDDRTYPQLRFSALPAKVEKYIAVPKFLCAIRAGGSTRALDHFLGGHVFNAKHLTGKEWGVERAALDKLRERFEDLLGTLTAMHTMMDLGLKTIKPDRVMTYLFSQLGWLQTLPASLTKDEVMRSYLHPDVIDEMVVRSDVLAHRLDQAGYAQTHRLLDIWMVKYGQEATPEWGLTVNLQDQGRNIREILNEVKAGQAPATHITVQEAAQLWPVNEFAPVPIRSAPKKGRAQDDGDDTVVVRANARRTRPHAGGARARPSTTMLSDQETAKLFSAQWKVGFATRPDIYPSRIENGPKDTILRLIARGMNPEAAFLSVLGAQDA